MVGLRRGSGCRSDLDRYSAGYRSTGERGNRSGAGRLPTQQSGRGPTVLGLALLRVHGSERGREGHQGAILYRRTDRFRHHRRDDRFSIDRDHGIADHDDDRRFSRCQEWEVLAALHTKQVDQN